MKRGVYLAALALILLGGGQLTFAQDAASDGAPTPGSAPAIVDPALVKNHYREVLGQPTYQDDLGLDVNATMRNWLSGWFARIGEDFNHFTYSRQMPRFASMLMSVLVTLSIAALIYTLVRLGRRGRFDHRSDPQQTAGDKVFRQPESYDQELRRAVETQNWHEAWLACWRQFLARLEHGRMVEADRSRTNREYLQQLRTHPLPEAAETLLPHLVETYDQFIYGRRPIAEPDWETFHHQVNEAALMLHLLRPTEIPA